MKHRINYISIFLVVFTLVLGTSCKKTFFTEANNNPNSPDSSSIVPSVLLSTVEGNLAYTQGGDLSRYTSLITQQTNGASRQAQGYYGYVFTSVDFDSPWGNLYTSVFENNKKLLSLSEAKGDNAYSGISRILMAYSLQVAVDLWGSIPYSSAFQGSNNLQPVFDNDKVLYDTITNLLNAGIVQLGKPNSGGDRSVPGIEDVIYGGNTGKWIKFAHAIKARLAIHQSKSNPAMASTALKEAALSFSQNTDNAQYIFGTTETSANPWYQFNEQRGDIGFGISTLGTVMLADHDPRFTAFMDTTNQDVNQVGMGPYYGNISSPVEFITYDEILFIKAEATLRSTGNIALAQNYYDSAILMNMNKLGVAAVDGASYIAVKGVLPTTSANAAIAQVASEEFVALYLNPEAFAVWRRTGVPSLTPTSGTNIPRRFLYPQTEYSYNSGHVPASTTLFSPKIFWDN